MRCDARMTARGRTPRSGDALRRLFVNCVSAYRTDTCTPTSHLDPRRAKLLARNPAFGKERLCVAWLAYCGSPVVLEKALYSPVHSLIEQGLHSTLGAEATHGDGFGIGWYDDQPLPGRDRIRWRTGSTSSPSSSRRSNANSNRFALRPAPTAPLRLPLAYDCARGGHRACV